MSLISKINNEDMVDISLNSDKFTGILKLLNQHQKMQDHKLAQLETKIDEMQKIIQDSTFKDEIASKIANIESVVTNLNNEIQSVKNSCDNKIENSIKELIVQQSVQNRNLLDGFESRIRQITDETFSKEIEEINGHIKVLSSQIENPQNTTSSDNLIQSSANLIPNNNDDTKYIELLAATNSNKEAINQLTEKVDIISQKVDNSSVPNNVRQRTLDISNKNKQNNSLDPFFEIKESISMICENVTQQQDEINTIKKYLSHRELITRPIFYAIIDDLILIHSHASGMDGIPVQNFQHVSPNYFKDDDEYYAKTRRYRSRFPPKNSNNAEETANEDKIATESVNEKEEESVNEFQNLQKEEEEKLHSTPPKQNENEKQITDVQHSSHFDPFFSTFKENALLQSQIQTQIQNQVKAQIKHQLQKYFKAFAQEQKQTEKENENEEKNENDNENDIVCETSNRGLTRIVKDEGRTIINNFQNNTVEILGTTGRSKPILTRTVNFVVVDMKIGDSLSESEISQRTRDLTFMLGQFMRDKNDLMSKIDRKVDRDFVERLFDKFRIILNEMNDKVHNIQNGNCRYATMNHIEEVVRMIENVKSSLVNLLSSQNNEGAAGKRSCPECLFCGRKISLVTGGISARSLGDYEESTQFVYGDGGVFKKANTISSKPNLPPLKSGLS